VVVGASGGAPETLVGPGRVVSRPAEVAAALVHFLDGRRPAAAPAGLDRYSWARAVQVLEQVLAVG
jgi:hypothetical protein